MVLLYTALLASHIVKCWSQYRITLFAFVLVLFEHPQSQAYIWIQMRCLWNWGREDLLLSTIWKWALTLLIWLSILSSMNALLHPFRDILVKYAHWAFLSCYRCYLFHNFTTTTTSWHCLCAVKKLVTDSPKLQMKFFAKIFCMSLK